LTAKEIHCLGEETPAFLARIEQRHLDVRKSDRQRNSRQAGPGPEIEEGADSGKIKTRRKFERIEKMVFNESVHIAGGNKIHAGIPLGKDEEIPFKERDAGKIERKAVAFGA